MLFWLLTIAATIGYKWLKSVLGCICTISAHWSYSLADNLISSPFLVPVLMIRNPIAGSTGPENTNLSENINMDGDEVFYYEEMSRYMSASSCGPIDGLQVDTESRIGQINITSANTAELIPSTATAGPVLSTAIAELIPSTTTTEPISSTTTAADPTPVAPENINVDDNNDSRICSSGSG
ncbi:hypothetical protein BU17DRAFT_96196 [Hysterangium stoloniferum]|nr:hypothetical protein BU17DRAFT_96196 [Hysterangium stoloniferum]